MTSEAYLSRAFTAILSELQIGAEIVQDSQVNDALGGLERFLPEVLAEIHAEWQGEGLDGFELFEARKSGEAEVELLGICWLISDRSVAPLHLQFQIAESGEEISWMECRLGERGHEGLVRSQPEAKSRLMRLLYSTQANGEKIDWAYEVTFGERSWKSD
ncbi:hypothetical protein [Planctomicrobium piriforme]|uniref:Uncharacterized protein n=1 Tax=Planctomicrobium piriforme TaxID=1576369 RepID=A0A1I3MK57_9PLAN|nr:hypothetical protein [Planctomicrobium piriforme]SFI97398.1 hypothetical protein SAMN05421753_11432 [Planctomicrobium piriforme]